MKQLLALLLLASLSASAQHEAPKAPAIEGRWDLTLHQKDRKAPSWLEVSHSGIKTLVGQFVADGGSARPISEVFHNNGKFHFAIPAQWENTNMDHIVEGTVNGDSMSGTVRLPNGNTWPFTGVRAPSLARSGKVSWGSPIKLFNGKDLTGWTALGKTNQWVVENGVLKSPQSGANIRSEKTFTDFKLHIEFRYPAGSNSGVYLRGRYEVQVDDAMGMEPTKGDLGAIYGFIKPNEVPAKPAGEWQSYDITLIGRFVTVALNGKTIIYNQEIPGITGGAIDSNEGQPGPIMMQGDHGPIEYRNIIITPAK